MAKYRSKALLDGIIAKRIDLPYQSGERTGMEERNCVPPIALSADFDMPMQAR